MRDMFMKSIRSTLASATRFSVAMFSFCGAFAVLAAGFDGKTLTTNDWFDASFTALTASDTAIAQGDTTGITLGAGSWTAVPATGTAKIVEDADNNSATVLSVEAPEEELEFTPAAFASPTGMETVTFKVKADAIDTLPTPSDAQTAFTLYSADGSNYALMGYVSDGTAGVWTNLTGVAADALVNTWYDLTMDFCGENSERLVRFAVKGTVLSDSDGTTWFPVVKQTATTINSLSFSGVGDVKTFSGDSLTTTDLAFYNGLGYATVEEAVAAAGADGFSAGSVKLLNDASWTPDRPGSVQIDTNGHTLTLPSSSSVFSTTAANGVYTTTYIYDASGSDVYLLADPVVEGITADSDAAIDGCTDQYRYTARTSDYTVGGKKFNGSQSSVDPSNFARGGMSTSYRSDSAASSAAATDEYFTSAFVNMLAGYYGSPSENVDSTITLKNLSPNRPYKFRFFLQRCTFTAEQYLKVSIGGISSTVYFNPTGAVDGRGQFVTFTFVPKTTQAVVTLSSDDGQGTHTQYQAFLVTCPDLADYEWAGADGAAWNATGLNWTGSSAAEDIWTAPFSAYNNAVFATDASAVVDGSVSMYNMNVASNLTLSGSGSVTVGGALTKTGPGVFASEATLNVASYVLNGGTADLRGQTQNGASVKLESAQMTSSDDSMYRWPYGAKLLLDSEWTFDGFSGRGVLESSAKRTLNVASGSSGMFTGTISGAGAVEKTGDGELVLLGTNTFSGPLVVSGGTLRLGDVDELPNVRYNMDATKVSTVTTNENASTLASWASTTGSRVYGLDSGIAPVYTNNDETVFGGLPAMYFFQPQDDETTGSRLRLDEGNSNSRTKMSRTAFIVYQANADIDDSSATTLWGYSGSETRALRLRGSGNSKYWIGTQSSGDVTRGIFVNAVQYASSNLVGTSPQLVSWIAAEMMASSSNAGYEDLGVSHTGKKGFYGAIGQILTFTRQLSKDEQQAVEAYLMSKWGIGGAAYHAIPETADVTVASGATLDLGGLTQTVASFSGAGTLQNGTLMTPGNIYTNTGALTIPAYEGMKIVLSADATALTITGDADNITIEPTAEFLATGRSITITGTELSSALAVTGVPFRFAAVQSGDGVWTLGVQTTGFEAATYVWTGAKGDGLWSSLGNWSVEGYDSVAVLPQSVDTVRFATENAAVSLSEGTTVGDIVVDEAATFTIPDNSPLRSPMVRGEGVITLTDGFFAPVNAENAKCVVSNDIVFASGYDGSAHLSGTDYQTIDMVGAISGSGTFTIAEGGRRNAGIVFRGSAEGFSGSIAVRCSNKYRRDQTKFLSTNAVNANVAYSFWGDDSSDTFQAADGEAEKYWRLGSVSGRIYMKSTSARGHTIEVGALNTDFSCGGDVGHKNQSGAWHYLNTVRKIGTGLFTSSIENVGVYDIAEGNLLLETNALPITEIAFNGGTLVLTNAFNETDLDIAAKIAHSQSPISIDTGADSYTFTSPLADSNKGGLVKKGDGTLVLGAAPEYKGDTVLNGGTLKIPAKAGVAVKTTEAGKKVVTRSDTIDGVEYTVYTLEAKKPFVFLVY